MCALSQIDLSESALKKHPKTGHFWSSASVPIRVLSRRDGIGSAFVVKAVFMVGLPQMLAGPRDILIPTRYAPLQPMHARNAPILNEPQTGRHRSRPVAKVIVDGQGTFPAGRPRHEIRRRCS